RIEPPFLKEVGPDGTATHGINLEMNRLTGSVIHYTDKELVTFEGAWQPRAINGFWNLFSYNLLEASGPKAAEISYNLPIMEDGTYQVFLLYLPNSENASNVKLKIKHSDGVSQKLWNMKKGNKFGFAVEIGRYNFTKNESAFVTISNRGADGIVVADSVAFAKVCEK
ncbi:MAG: hypothetical protein KJO79_11160, partial [Verrucomicrobiae bacterium]|nr:hypothetical protein [Verrucomicrobiae bacterium]NNJ87733.1 hypothetical protein [Akkermansiaceae bacterium]